MKIKKFLIHTNNITRDSIMWNMLSSMLLSFQSVIMLVILTRILGLIDAGIYTIAYANANLFLTIGKYGMRTFQVSDINDQFSFQEYLFSRVITSLIMLIVSIAYIIYIGDKNGYSVEKSLVVIWMCAFKAVDAFEDVYHGLYQQKGRLDIAGKAMTMRLGITVIVFGLGIILLKDLLIALIITTVITIVLLIILTKWSYEFFTGLVKKGYSMLHIRELLKICFPLFLGSFLSFYIGNAPKYAIDSILNDELQACYGFIAMPVFVIGLLNNFIFTPMIYKMSIIWNQGEKGEFVKAILHQIVIVAGITTICITGAYLIGIPVLSVLYSTDLSAYKCELIILLLGGGFLALSGLLVTIITIIRFQRYVLIGYVVVAFLAFVLSRYFVEQYSVTGAAGLYLVLMIFLCLIFSLLLSYGLWKKGKLNEKVV